ncbi:helix-turn-helix transcriptional regulator [uncultured Ruegeria sp.]|uniref:ArsR/SmtB family transcription factor n=1 Tax=uncultured Ruegeria sp. TaxID=259304 RepID=UPI00262212E0|nr:metalloregulator ArsR/SmtB family transcription factor [uncultured Ruegeria sp.]
MQFEPRLDIIGAALADSSRVRILCELMDGRSHTGKELASVAGIAPNTASEHLSKLLDIGMITAERTGRCIYYRIVSDEVAETLEQMSALSPTDHLYRGRNRQCPPELIARTCYNHIAGRLGVLMAKRLMDRGWISVEGATAAVTQSGTEHLRRIGFLSDTMPFLLVKCCLDWSERRHHFSGPLGSSLLNHALSQKWLTRPRHGRVLHIEPKGFAAFDQYFGISRTALFRQVDAT